MRDENRPSEDAKASLCLRGAREICEAVAESPRSILHLVRDEGLPAWRARPGGVWKALPEDLRDWLARQRDQSLADVGPAPTRGRPRSS